MKIVFIMFYTLVMVFSTLFVWHKLLNQKMNFKSYKFYFSLLGMSLVTISNFLITNKFVRIALITIIFMLFVYYLFKTSIQKVILIPIYTQLILMISEIIYALILTLLGVNINITITSPFINMISNVVISIIFVINSNLKIIKKIYNKLIIFTDRINHMQLTFFSVIIIMILNVLLMSVYYKIKFIYLLIFSCFLILINALIIFNSFKTHNKYNKVSDKYNVAINSLTDYEDMMNKYKITAHENKNLLLSIRAMIMNKEKNIPEYIDSLVENKYDDDERLLIEMNVIPSGGLRATIYSELLKIKKQKIKYSLNIDSKIETVDLIEMETDDVVAVCKIIGVYIDNAIDEVKALKIKNIDISLYLEDEFLCVKISNNYKSMIDISQINNEGYTTKGIGHGYGLSLVKNIIENNNAFSGKTEISKKVFSQILYIKHDKRIRNES